MDWMYDGTGIQKDDYLLGKKIDKKYGESENNGNCQLNCCIYTLSCIIHM